MAIGTGDRRAAPPPPMESNHARPPRGAHWGPRICLLALSAFTSLTAIGGAIFVVPTMPRAVLRQGMLALFPDYTIPALALGVLCGGGALVAFVAVLARPRIGALASIVAGVLMIGFELVEIAVVGFTSLMNPDQFPAWLQVIYLAVGAAMLTLGARLLKAEAASSRATQPTS